MRAKKEKLRVVVPHTVVYCVLRTTQSQVHSIQIRIRNSCSIVSRILFLSSFEVKRVRGEWEQQAPELICSYCRSTADLTPGWTEQPAWIPPGWGWSYFNCVVMAKSSLRSKNCSRAWLLRMRDMMSWDTLTWWVNREVSMLKTHSRIPHALIPWWTCRHRIIAICLKLLPFAHCIWDGHTYFVFGMMWLFLLKVMYFL